jgi:hypothetical protein
VFVCCCAQTMAVVSRRYAAFHRRGLFGSSRDYSRVSSVGTWDLGRGVAAEYRSTALHAQRRRVAVIIERIQDMYLVHWDRCPLPRRGDLIALLPFCSCPSACLCLSAQVQQPGSLALPHSRSSHSHSRASLLGPRTESSEASVRSHADGMSRPCPSER